MRYQDVKIGERVRISPNIDRTDAAFSSNSYMMKMRGKVYVIQNISRERKAIIIEGWEWHPDDLQIVNCEKKEHPFHFDVGELTP